MHMIVLVTFILNKSLVCHYKNKLFTKMKMVKQVVTARKTQNKNFYKNKNYKKYTKIVLIM